MATEIVPTEKFLHTLFGGLEGYIEFRLIGKQKTTQHFFPIKRVLGNWPHYEKQLLAANQKGANVFFGVNPRTDKVGDAAHIKECQALWADLDYKDPELLKKNCAALSGYSLKPSIVVDSGHGYHFYWTLKEPVAPEKAEKAMREIARVLAGDRVWDAPRILRLPGTMNLKDDPVKCGIVRFFPVREYLVDDFERLETAASGIPPSGGKPKPTAVQKTELCTPNPTDDIYGNGHGWAHTTAQALAPFWTEGARHKLSMGLAKLLKEEEVTKEGAVLLIRKISTAANDDEIDDRVRAVTDTYTSTDKRLSGSGLIAEALGDERAKSFWKVFNAAASSVPPPPVLRLKTPEFDPYKCVPPGSVFDKYVWYADACTDAPLQFHLASIITLAGAAIGNRTWIDYYGRKPLYPNLYTLLIAPPGRFRKSTAIHHVRRLGSDSETKEYPSDSTVERLYEAMAPTVIETRTTGEGKKAKEIPVAWRGEPEGIIYHSEFSKWLNVSKLSYMQVARSFFTDLYDGGRLVRETKNHGRYIIEKPAISMLCGITPNAVKESTSRKDIEDGFLSRFLIIPKPKHYKGKYSLQTSEGRPTFELYDDISAKLTIIKNTSFGSVKFSDAADAERIKFEKWIEERSEKHESDGDDRSSSVICRMPAMACKIALIYAYAARTPVGRIEEEDIVPAVNLCKYSSLSMERLLDEIRADEGNREAQYKDRVLDAIRRWGEKRPGEAIPRKLLQRNVHLTSDQFRQAIESIKEEQRIREVRTRGGRGVSYLLHEKEVEC